MEAPSSGPARKRKDIDADPAAGDGGNRLLAGYLAHEFLSSGTVLGERHAAGPRREAGQPVPYEAVALLVQRGGARVPGVVNPAQLAAWAQR
uniref:Uncharacterized protein n=1 Tax=Arundo donax TaxID=35708 RepID=A0A0A9AVH9_ARUDO